MSSMQLVDGNRKTAQFRWPLGLEFLESKKQVIVADMLNNAIRILHLETENVTTMAGTGAMGHKDGLGKESLWHQPLGLAIDIQGQRLFVGEVGNCTIRVIDLSNQLDYPVTTLVGCATKSSLVDGFGVNARITNPGMIRLQTLDDGNLTLLVAGFGDHSVRRIYISNQYVETIAGDKEFAKTENAAIVLKREPKKGFKDGNVNNPDQSQHPLFNCIYGVEVDPFGNIYIADASNSAVRVLSKNGDVRSILATPEVRENETRIDGELTQATLYKPRWLHWQTNGNLLVAEPYSLRRIYGVTNAERNTLLVSKRLFRLSRLLFLGKRTTEKDFSKILHSQVLETIGGTFFSKSALKTLFSFLNARQTLGRFVHKDVSLFFAHLDLFSELYQSKIPNKTEKNGNEAIVKAETIISTSTTIPTQIQQLTEEQQQSQQQQLQQTQTLNISTPEFQKPLSRQVKHQAKKDQFKALKKHEEELERERSSSNSTPISTVPSTPPTPSTPPPPTPPTTTINTTTTTNTNINTLKRKREEEN